MSAQSTEDIKKAAAAHALRYAGADGYALYKLAFEVGALWERERIEKLQQNKTLKKELVK